MICHAILVHVTCYSYALTNVSEFVYGGSYSTKCRDIFVIKVFNDVKKSELIFLHVSDLNFLRLHLQIETVFNV